MLLSLFKPAVFLSMSAVSMASGIYQKPAQVVRVGKTETILETADENQWAVRDTSFVAGRNVKVTFYDNGTPYFILDDEVREVR